MLSFYALSASADLQNPGFESGQAQWSTEGPNPVAVVQSEGFPEFAVYENQPNTPVTPNLGLQMVRIGVPESPGDQNNNQINGVTRVTQTFTAGRSTLQLATRIWSTEFRNNRDSVSVRLLDAGDQPVTLPVSGLQSCSATGCTIKLDAGRNGDVLDSGWQAFQIGNQDAGLIVGATYTLAYELTTGGGSSHPSWVYFDDVNTPPLADAGGPYEGPYFIGNLITLDGSGSSDAEGDPLTYSWTLTSVPEGSTAQLDDATLEQPSFTPDALGDYVVELIVNDGTADSEPDTATISVVNQPPVAVFSCNPGGISGIALEGDFVACDASASFDPDDPDNAEALTDFSWRISSAALPADILLAGKIAGFYAPQNGGYSIELSVSDGIDISTADNSGAGANVAAPSSVGNANPLAQAVDVEVLEGFTSTLRCRGVDPGAEDTLSASFSIPGSSLVGFDEISENDPAYATIAATAGFTLTSDNRGVLGSQSCTVSDSNSGSGFADFTVSEVPASELYPETGGRFEPNESSLTAVKRVAGKAFLARLETSTDVDFYELRIDDGTPDGMIPPVGTEFLVRVKMPTDYDAVLLSKPIGDPETTIFQSAPFVSYPFVSYPFVSYEQRTAPFVSYPFVSYPAQTAPFVSYPFVSYPFVSYPFETSPFVSYNFTVADFPLSQMADAPNGSDASGDALALGEIGSLNVASFEQDNLRVKDLSANFNTPAAPYETLFGVKTADEQAIYLAVLSYDGVYSPEPYEVAVEASQPLDTEAFLDSQCPVGAPDCPCSGSPLTANAGGEVIRAGSNPTTLIVTQRQRLQALEGIDDVAWNTFIGAITPWMNAVDARFVSLPSADFDAWDQSPCDINSLSTLADALGGLIKAQLANTNISSVIILGDFDVFPSDSDQDFTQIGNEGLFLRDMPVLPESPIATVFRAGHFLSDACFTDTDPIPFNGGLFCIEDVPTGRLVSTQRLQEQVESFVSTGGNINYASGLVTGYDFFQDLAGKMSNSLTNLGSVDLLNTDTWTSQDLEPLWCAVNPDAAGVQAHASFNAFLAADGFNKNDLTDVTTVNECAGDPDSLTATVGCHSLTFIPASSTLPAEFFPTDPAETWADRAGTWVGVYGYGLGHTDTDDLGTEGILKRFFACIGDNAVADPPLTVGQCLLEAKVDYLQARTSIDAYDVKSVMTLAISGIPDVTVVPSAAEGEALFAAFAAPPPPGCSGTGFSLTVDGSPTLSSPHCLEEVIDSGGRGSYFKIDDQYQSGTGRVLLPTLQVSSNTVTPGNAARSMSIVGGDYELLIGFDPVVGNLRTEWNENVPESRNSCVRTMAPTEIGVINQLPVGSGVQEAFNLTTAQFECTVPPDTSPKPPITGNLRKFDSLDVELKRPLAGTEGDFNPPDVTQRDIISNATTGNALALVNATDNDVGDSGMSKINVLVYTEDRVNGGPGTVESYACPGDPTFCTVDNVTDPNTASEIFLPGAAGKFVAIEYFDNAGNKILKSGKGILVEAVEVVIRATTFNIGSETMIRVEIERLEEFLDNGLTLTIDYGDGGQDEFFLDANLLCGDPNTNPPNLQTDCITILPDGNGVFVTDYLFDVPGQTSFTVTVTVRGAASGYDEAVLSLCQDDTGETLPDGDIESCAFSASGTNVDIDMFVVGEIDDDAFKYRVRVFGDQFQYANGKLSKPGGSNEASVQLLSNEAGQTKGIRFSFDAGKLGWDGQTPFQVEQSTQDGVKGGPSQGTTDVNTFEASVGGPGI